MTKTRLGNTLGIVSTAAIAVIGAVIFGVSAKAGELYPTAGGVILLVIGVVWTCIGIQRREGNDWRE